MITIIIITKNNNNNNDNDNDNINHNHNSNNNEKRIENKKIKNTTFLKNQKHAHVFQSNESNVCILRKEKPYARHSSHQPSS